jgi:hypothetical protein
MMYLPEGIETSDVEEFISIYSRIILKTMRSGKMRLYV